MAHRIAIIPASTQSGRETIRALLASEAKPFVRGIYRDSAKAPTAFTQQPNFEAVQGDVAKPGLDFSGFDAVYYTPPPTYDRTNPGQFTTQTANNIKDALKSASSVKRLVLHSAIGAHNNHGIGIARINHITDQILKDVVSEVVILKPAYYFETWAADAPNSIRESPPHFVSALSPAEYAMPMVSAKDVGKQSAKFLLGESSKPGFQAFDLFGPRHYNSIDFKNALEEITGKEIALKTIDKDDLVAHFEELVPKVYAQEFADMHIALLPGGVITKDFEYDKHTIRGEVELMNALRDLLSQ